MIQKFLCCILLAQAFLITNAHPQSLDSLIVAGKKSINAGVDNWNENQLQQARAHFERLLTGKQREALVRYYLGYCDYRLAIYYRQKSDLKMTNKHLEQAVLQLEAANKLNNKFAEALALLASCYGQQIGMAPMLGMTLGPKSAQLMQTAVQLAPENPRVAMLEAISAYYTPESFGGSKSAAFAGFQRATQLFEQGKSIDPSQPDWGHAEAYAWLGLAHLDKNNNAAARQAFDHALKLTPDYAWVKNQLYPRTLETK